ncbi:MAG: hypothetical protein DRI48_03185 [Chloroflexi bacterium]|nr:MAG: hypothetical protein DRI48_03185 [Chloroflexota bacterium]
MYKLLMFWNILPGREDEYFEFVIRELGPGMIDLGVKPTDAWYTQYGDRPQILTGGVAEDLESLERALASEEWRKLKKKLLNYVTDYRQKIVRASGGFQL